MSGSSLSADEPLSWWRRPAGDREVLKVSLPLVVSSLSWTVMTFVDRMFLHGKWRSMRVIEPVAVVEPAGENGSIGPAIAAAPAD